MPEKPLLQVQEISKSFGEKLLLQNASVTISEKQKIGVIGRNGAGKTTFFKMILGEIEPDSGSIVQMPSLRLGYIEQHDPFIAGDTVISFLERYTHKPVWECAKIAAQFQLKNERLDMPISSLSGGWQMRVKLAATLLFEPNLLLLDEPTNYLDLSTLVLLEQFLLGFRGAVMVITHDREFLKKTCDHTLDVEHGKLFLHPEPLEEYLEYKAEQKALAESLNTNIERKQKQLQTFVDRFGAKASMAKSAQSKLKQIEKLDNKKIGINNPFSTVKMHIPSIEPKQGLALECKNLEIGYPDKSVGKNINFEVERGQKVAILGDNGQGKSTLLKTIAGILSPLSGSALWKPSLSISYYNQHVSQALNPKIDLLEYVKSVASRGVNDEEIYKVLGNFLFSKIDSSKQIGVLSGGEKARLCLAGMFLTKSSVYLLDEPTNHLDFETVEAMGEALGAFNGTVFVVSHNRTFVNLIANKIIEVKNGEVKQVNGSYEDYVWQLEQDARQEFGLKTEQSSNQTQNQNSEQKTSINNKENAKKLYELRKDLLKAESKMNKLKITIDENQDPAKNPEYLALLGDVEITWLEIQDKMEALK